MGFFASSGILNSRGFFSAPVSAVPPPPSGIPVADTYSINLVDPDYAYLSGNYPFTDAGAFTDDIGVTTINQYGQLIDDILAYGYPYILFNITANRWEFGFYDEYGEGGLAWYLNGLNAASNPSSNQDYIPTTGWSRNITITAA